MTKSDSFYDLIMEPMDCSGCKISLIRKRAEKEIVHTPEEYDFPDSLYQEHWEKAEAYGVVSDSGDLLACIEVCPEEYTNNDIKRREVRINLDTSLTEKNRDGKILFIKMT